MKRKVLYSILSIILTIGLLPATTVSAFAQGTDSQMTVSNSAVSSNLGKVMNKLEVSKDAFDYTDPALAKAEADTDFPEKFDLRDVDGVSYVTPVKFQIPFSSSSMARRHRPASYSMRRSWQLMVVMALKFQSI